MVLNDADAAGLAEVKYGATSARTGTVLFLTLGTGLGRRSSITGFFSQHRNWSPLRRWQRSRALPLRVREEKQRPLIQAMGKAVKQSPEGIRAAAFPDLFLIGGGISRKAEKWVPLLDVETPVEPAILLNRAGIVGAVLAATGEGIEP